jgi:hypothetical protein
MWLIRLRRYNVNNKFHESQSTGTEIGGRTQKQRDFVSLLNFHKKTEETKNMNSVANYLQ